MYKQWVVGFALWSMSHDVHWLAQDFGPRHSGGCYQYSSDLCSRALNHLISDRRSHPTAGSFYSRSTTGSIHTFFSSPIYLQLHLQLKYLWFVSLPAFFYSYIPFLLLSWSATPQALGVSCVLVTSSAIVCPWLWSWNSSGLCSPLHHFYPCEMINYARLGAFCIICPGHVVRHCCAVATWIENF